MSQSYGIGDQNSASAVKRLEWRLNQIQQAIVGGGASPAVETLLTDLLAVVQLIQSQTDGIELTSENISLNADNIRLNTDQVEALLDQIRQALSPTGAAVTAGVEALLQPILNGVQNLDLLVYQGNLNTDGLEGLATDANSKLDTLVSQTDGLEATLTNQAALTTASNTKLDALVAQTDGVEGGISSIDASVAANTVEVVNVALAAQAIAAQTDQIESLLATIDTHLLALQSQVGNTAALEARLIEVRDQVIASVATTVGLEALLAIGNDTLTSLSAEINSSTGNGGILSTGVLPKLQQIIDLTNDALLLQQQTALDGGTIAANTASLLSLASAEGADVALIQAAVANVLATLLTIETGTSNDLNGISLVLADQLDRLNQIYGTASNSESSLNSLRELINDAGSSPQTLVARSDTSPAAAQVISAAKQLRGLVFANYGNAPLYLQIHGITPAPAANVQPEYPPIPVQTNQVFIADEALLSRDGFGYSGCTIRVSTTLIGYTAPAVTPGLWSLIARFK
jgi:hypothetical protein